MRRASIALLGIALVSSAFLSAHPRAGSDRAANLPPAAARFNARPPQTQSAAVARPESAPDAHDAFVQQYCVSCHNPTARRGELSLAAFEIARADEHAEVAEKMIRKLRAGMMPPPGARPPDPAAVAAIVEALESRIDRAASARPNPGSRPFQRLNRAEYARAIRDLLAIDVDVAAFLPADLNSSHGFDNIADEQALSPTLMDGYLRAAGNISRLAIGDRHATTSAATYTVPITASQMRHAEGAPMGTRGGISTMHVFPADGEYAFRVLLFGGPTGDLFGSPAAAAGEQIEVSVNGERVALLDIKPGMKESDPNGLTLHTPKVHVAAGAQRVSAAFIRTFEGPVNDLIAPIEYTLADTNIGEGPGVTAPPHLKELTITGPLEVSGVSDTASRERIFSCRPAVGSQETACARSIIERLARQAFRGYLEDADLADLMRFYERGRREGDFENGVQWALQAMLAHPYFVFRLERAPANVRPGQNYRISNLDLASRLSFFLWASIPDAELLKVAGQGRLNTPAVLEAQVRRMLADPRSESLSTRFAAQWLRLGEVEKFRPDQLLYPHWDDTLAKSLKRETELFFDSLVRDDRSVLDLLRADYTFANERVAKHYGLPNVMGEAFRRVPLPSDTRRGILGHGSVLMLTSIADRTSPVLRGKWVMQVLLGSPPPPPPPNVPELDATKVVKGAKLLSVRERMEEHRANPACTSCHRVIDPLGLALENFDASGAWRIRDGDTPVDASGVLYDGTKLDGPVSLRNALLARSDVVLSNFAENLLSYALGRPVEYYDMPVVRTIVREAAANDNRVSSFILGIVKSTPFQMSRAASAPPTDSNAAAKSERR